MKQSQSQAEIDSSLAALLTPAARAPDRLFAARVDRAIDDLAHLHAAERHYARGFARELLALAAVVLAAVFWLGLPGLGANAWLVALPVGLLMLVLLGDARQPVAGSSSAP